MRSQGRLLAFLSFPMGGGREAVLQRLLPLLLVFLLVSGILAVTGLAYRLGTIQRTTNGSALAAISIREALVQSRVGFESYLYHTGADDQAYRPSLALATSRATQAQRDAASTSSAGLLRQLVAAISAYGAATERISQVEQSGQHDQAVALWQGEGDSNYVAAQTLVDAVISNETQHLGDTFQASRTNTWLLFAGFAYLATAVAICCGTAGYWLRSWQLNVPMVALLSSVERAGHGDVLSPIEPGAHGELHELALGIEWLRRTMREQQQHLADRMEELELSREQVELSARQLERAYQQEALSRQELASLVQSTTAIAAQLALEPLLQSIVREAAAAFRAREAWILLRHEDPQRHDVEVWALGRTDASEPASCTVDDLGLGDRTDPGRPYVWTLPRAGAVALGLAPDENLEVLVAPLTMGRAIQGALVLLPVASRQVASNEIELAQVFASQSAVALENARLYATVDEERRLAAALVEASAILNTTRDVSQLLPLTLDRLGSVLELETESTAIGLFDAGRQKFTIVASRGLHADALSALEIPLDELDGVVRTQLMLNRQPFRGEREMDLPASLRARMERRQAPVGSFLIVPLVWQSEVLGLLLLISSRPVRLSNPRLAVLSTFSYHAAIATKNAALLEAERATVARLEQSNQARAELTSIVSHELKSPLAMLHNYAALLLNYGAQLTEEQRQAHIQHIYKESGQLINLVRDILDVSRMDAELLDYDMRLFSLSELVAQTCARYVAVAATHEIHCDVREETAVLGDPARLKQVLVNLIDNAIKYSPGNRHVRVALRVHEAQRTVEVSVADDGIGLAPEEQALLFRKFSRVRNEATAAIHGSGLGLYICAKIIEAHAGSYRVTSVPGTGSTISFSLPLAARGQPSVESLSPASVLNGS